MNMVPHGRWTYGSGKIEQELSRQVRCGRTGNQTLLTLAVDVFLQLGSDQGLVKRFRSMGESE